MSAPSSGGGGRSRRLGALSLDDDGTSGIVGVVEKRADKTVPLAIYGATTGQGRTPLPPPARPSLASGNDGTTTAPLPAQSAPPAASTPVPPSAHAVSATPTPSSTAARGAIDKGDDDIEGPPLSKTPWVAIGVVGIVVVIIGVIAAVVLGGSSKPGGAAGAAGAVGAAAAKSGG